MEIEQRIISIIHRDPLGHCTRNIWAPSSSLFSEITPRRHKRKISTGSALQENLGARVINCRSFEQDKFNHRHFYYHANHKILYYRPARVEATESALAKLRLINPRFYRSKIDTEGILFPRLRATIHLPAPFVMEQRTVRVKLHGVLIQQLFFVRRYTQTSMIYCIIRWARRPYSRFIVPNWQTDERPCILFRTELRGPKGRYEFSPRSRRPLLTRPWIINAIRYNALSRYDSVVAPGPGSSRIRSFSSVNHQSISRLIVVKVELFGALLKRLHGKITYDSHGTMVEPRNSVPRSEIISLNKGMCGEI